ncbi:hypothetical protein [Thermogemmatispora sp.]|uniref:hypothetical protein n=1 Tax=Thermogemmatispora sp. TaxID=1968838 RepID=UPI001D46403E|nr:hypothetical protein [Thermogemmatispora sp.]MBX5450204.1 hypothetical protein [Thermogemmatispora sp.]
MPMKALLRSAQAVYRPKLGYSWLLLLILVILMGSLTTACSSMLGGNTPTQHAATTPTPATVALNQLHWCGKPSMLFRDEGASVSPTAATATVTSTTTPSAQGTPTSGPRTLTDWEQVQSLLGFTVYLPPRLPAQSCLVSALGTVHDPIFGGNFSISYLLPDGSAISLSEAPHRNQKSQFQCTASLVTPTAAARSQTKATPTARVSPTPTRTPNQICSGVRGETSIVFSAPGDEQTLKQFFDSLQPNVAWVPLA